ncbi:MAG: SDR family NAD(P)-dependent oxidoreductase [Sulfitobacter sp.]
MKEWQGRRYWLVGASDGLGAALAQKMNASGAEVIISARSEDALRALTKKLPGKASYQTMDVSDNDSVVAAAKAVGHVDGVVFLAGVYWPFGATDWNADQANAMADINFTGLVRLMGQVVPTMVERDTGHIVITSSLSGFRGLPGSIGYTASKAGVMSLAESMYADLRKTGVQVQVVNPGFINTQLTKRNDFNMPFIMEPQKAATVMFEHMNTNRFKKSFPWMFSLVFRLGQFLPDSLYYRIFS